MNAEEQKVDHQALKCVSYEGVYHLLAIIKVL